MLIKIFFTYYCDVAHIYIHIYQNVNKILICMIHDSDKSDILYSAPIAMSVLCKYVRIYFSIIF